MNKGNKQERIKRGAWHYQRRALPAISTLFGTRSERQYFIQSWLIKPLGYASDFTGHFLLKLLPIDWCSGVGAFLGRVVMKTKYKRAVENMRQNLKVILPEATPEQREAIVTKNCENLGRLMTEFSVLTRICKQDKRVKTEGLERAMASSKNTPIILVTLHLGNWEVLPSIAKKHGLQFHTFYLPLGNPVERWVTANVRKKLGATLLPEGMAGVGPAMQVLRQGGLVSIFCDEGFGGKIRGPLFGRSAHLKGNLALATRLARKTGAKLCVVNAAREHLAHFKCCFSPVFELPAESNPKTDEGVLADVQFLNAQIEPIVKSHVSQWYYLHEQL